VHETEERNNMPNVNGKKFPYTKEGIAAAKKSAKTPKNTHKMPNGKLMKGAKHKGK
jgi:hypothetical protein